MGDVAQTHRRHTGSDQAVLRLTFDARLHPARSEHCAGEPARPGRHCARLYADDSAHRLSARTFPFAHIAPLELWSPAQLSLLLFKDFHLSNNLRWLMRQVHYTVTIDHDFEGVIVGCAGRRQGRWHLTWITPRIMRDYAEAFDAGHVHSYEVWNKAGDGWRAAMASSPAAPSPTNPNSHASQIHQKSVWRYSTSIWPNGVSSSSTVSEPDPCGRVWVVARSRGRTISRSLPKYCACQSRSAAGRSRPILKPYRIGSPIRTSRVSIR